jgi:hypothetical protein
MAYWRFSLSTFLFISLAAPIWILLLTCAGVEDGPWGGDEFDFIIAPLILCLITVAIHQALAARVRGAWALSALLSGLIVMTLFVISGSLPF